MINRFSPTKFDAILNLVGNTKHFSVSPEDEFKWLEDTDDGKPSEENIQIKLTELLAEWNAQEYARNRAPLYPTIGDQLDLLWHAIDTGDWTAAKVKTTDFYTKLKKVKDDNPKPS